MGPTPRREAGLSGSKAPPSGSRSDITSADSAAAGAAWRRARYQGWRQTPFSPARMKLPRVMIVVSRWPAASHNHNPRSSRGPPASARSAIKPPRRCRRCDMPAISPRRTATRQHHLARPPAQPPTSVARQRGDHHHRQRDRGHELQRPVARNRLRRTRRPHRRLPKQQNNTEGFDGAPIAMCGSSALCSLSAPTANMPSLQQIARRQPAR